MRNRCIIYSSTSVVWTMMLLCCFFLSFWSLTALTSIPFSWKKNLLRIFNLLWTWTKMSMSKLCLNCPILLLEGHRPAEFSSSQLQYTCLEVSNEPDLDHLLQMCLIMVGAQLCRTVDLQEQVWTPLTLVNYSFKNPNATLAIFT